MASDINQITLSGRLTNDVEVKGFENASLISGSLATNRSVKKNNEWKEEASFFNFKYWVKTQKQVDYFVSVLTKGAKVAVSGEMVQEKWEKDGKQNSRYVVNVATILSMSAKNGNTNNSSGQPTNNKNSSVPDYEGSDFPEDIPF